MATGCVCSKSPRPGPVPPPAYGGIEWIVHWLSQSLAERGHDVMLLTAGDSTTPVLASYIPSCGWVMHWSSGDPKGATIDARIGSERRAGRSVRWVLER
jgi:hypothetical protein